MANVGGKCLLGDENELNFEINFEERRTNEGKSNHVTFLFGGNCFRRTFIGGFPYCYIQSHVGPYIRPRISGIQAQK